MLSSVPWHPSPATNFKQHVEWGESCFIVKEISYGVDVKNQSIVLSSEHSEYQWLGYEEAYKRLTFDSNKVAIWELHERLKKLKD